MRAHFHYEFVARFTLLPTPYDKTCTLFCCGLILGCTNGTPFGFGTVKCNNIMSPGYRKDGSGPHALGAMPVQYGDFVQLSCISAFLRPEGRTESRDLQHEGEDIEALAKQAEGDAAPNFIGLYYKPNGNVRLAIPPIGKAATGQFTPSVFQLIDPHETQENPSYGRSVKYGDTVVLVDENGNALNNKVGGFFEGYIGPKARGKSGECCMSFHARERTSAMDLATPTYPSTSMTPIATTLLQQPSQTTSRIRQACRWIRCMRWLRI